MRTRIILPTAAALMLWLAPVSRTPAQINPISMPVTGKKPSTGAAEHGQRKSWVSPPCATRAVPLVGIRPRSRSRFRALLCLPGNYQREEEPLAIRRVVYSEAAPPTPSVQGDPAALEFAADLLTGASPLAGQPYVGQ